LSEKPIFFAYILAITALIALPLNTSSELNDITILQLRGDYFFHILMFLPWVFFRKAFTKSTQLKPPPLPSSLSHLSRPFAPVAEIDKVYPSLKSLKWLLLGLLFASATEGLQYVLPYRTFNINDLMANLLGILVGFALVLLINIRKRG